MNNSNIITRSNETFLLSPFGYIQSSSENVATENNCHTRVSQLRAMSRTTMATACFPVQPFPTGIGVTRYENEGKLEPPHRHRQASEFQYVIAGLTAYLDLSAAQEHVFRKGDFYVIEPGVAYAQKSAPGTEILFIKVPPGNDKVPMDTS